jgi:hypothetical protein
MGSVADYQTIQLLYLKFRQMQVYNITLEPVTLKFANLAIGTLTVNGKDLQVTAAKFSPNATLTSEIVDLGSDGCSTVRLHYVDWREPTVSRINSYQRW